MIVREEASYFTEARGPELHHVPAQWQLVMSDMQTGEMEEGTTGRGGGGGGDLAQIIIPPQHDLSLQATSHMKPCPPSHSAVMCRSLR